MNDNMQLDSQEDMRAMRSPASGSRTRCLRKGGGVALLVAALSAVVAIAATTGGAANAFALPVPFAEVRLTEVPLSDDLPLHAPPAPHPLYRPDSLSCGLHYAVVLDLAELARQYGKGSHAYRHAFGSVANQLDVCRTDERYAAASSGPADVPRAGAAVSSYD
ncbi:hypothetical protein [Paraburkholderia phenazinium]|jgi:hypothetical protein|uniref:Uncharacterized protein n=1 Tax=Paraburkholderia phenazinium TaxID=60549 RepID=A0A1G7SPS7_9BURK|nr:hypothetical protein [Paraburkholderia phenazinium]SDG24892.1 hypothetical protein SAMN05216466_102605 [Paraburkholderia phenazinium]